MTVILPVTKKQGYVYLDTLSIFCNPICLEKQRDEKCYAINNRAEYMTLSEVVKELKFIVQLLQTMNIDVELPITVHVDHVGAIWLSNNRTTSGRTKNIDIINYSVNEFQEDGKFII